MTTKEAEIIRIKGQKLIKSWSEDWCKWAREGLEVNLDKEQEAILTSVQFNPRTTVASGTARGKDFVTAVAALSFLYWTPQWNKKGELIGNTKVALTAPTDRQIKNIMMPEIARLYNRAKKKGIFIGRLNAYDIRTDNEEWFLTGFKADEHNHEAWSGFHAVNTMFAVTEASGISDDTFGAIEGNLQGNSRILLVFNPNVTIGYAAKSQKGERWSKFRLNSLTAPNVLHKKNIIPGQVDYTWIIDKIQNWCIEIREDEFSHEQDDFVFEDKFYRPEDIFRIKVLGKFPKVSEDVLLPEQWIEAAEKRYIEFHQQNGYDVNYYMPLVVGVDVAGMGRDSTVFCRRYGHIVQSFFKTNSGGRADHMQIAGRVVNEIRDESTNVFIDTIGEGAGVYSRLLELEHGNNVFSCKFSESGKDEFGNKMTDVTGQSTFANMRAYLFWAVRDLFNPRNGYDAMIAPGGTFKQEATEIKFYYKSNGDIMIEPKEDIKKRLTFSTDEFDALASTFYPQSRAIAQDLSGLA